MRVINGRLHNKMQDGFYHPMPLGMDDARDMKGKGQTRYSVDESTGKAYGVIERPAEMVLQYLSGGGTQITAAARDGSGEREFMKLDHDSAIIENGKAVNLDAGAYLDITDFWDIRGVTADNFSGIYNVIKTGPVEPWSTAEIRFRKGEPHAMLDGVIPSEDISVPVAVLFNENSSSGEVMPLADVSVRCSGKTVEYKAGCNIVAGMDDLCFDDNKDKQAGLSDTMAKMLSGLSDDDPTPEVPDAGGMDLA